MTKIVSAADTKTINKIEKIKYIKLLAGQVRECDNISNCYMYYALAALLKMQLLADKNKKQSRALVRMLKHVKKREGASKFTYLLRCFFPKLDKSVMNRYTRALDYSYAQGWSVSEFFTECKKFGVQKLAEKQTKRQVKLQKTTETSKLKLVNRVRPQHQSTPHAEVTKHNSSVFKCLKELPGVLELEDCEGILEERAMITFAQSGKLVTGFVSVRAIN